MYFLKEDEEKVRDLVGVVYDNIPRKDFLISWTEKQMNRFLMKSIVTMDYFKTLEYSYIISTIKLDNVASKKRTFKLILFCIIVYILCCF